MSEYNAWNKWRTDETYLEWLPEGFHDELDTIFRRRMGLSKGSCLITVRRITQQVLTRLGINHRKTEAVILSFAYGYTARYLERAGGRVFDYISRHGGARRSKTPMRRVYKFG